MTTIEIFAPITKREKDPVTGYVTVYGKMTGADVDLDEQRMDPDWLAKAVPAWFETGANVREMHKPSAVGKGTELTKIGDDYFLKSLIVDTEACNKVETDVYTGYSISVRGPRIVKDASAPGGRIVGGMIPETSIVDRPCLTSAKFLLAKSVDGAPDELEPRQLAGYFLTKDVSMTGADPAPGDPATGDEDEVDLQAIARDALSQWLASEAAEVAAGTGGSFVVSLICDLLANLDWAVEADAYDDASAALEAVKTVLTTPQEAEMINLSSIATLTKAATAADATEDDKVAVAELRKALGIDDLDTKIASELTKTATAEDLAKVAERLVKVETTVTTVGPTRVTTQQDEARSAQTTALLSKALGFEQQARQVETYDPALAAGYRILAQQSRDAAA